MDSTPARDTAPEAARLQIELWRGMSPLDKVRLLVALTRATQRLALEGIRRRHPGASEPECHLRLALLNLGPELARRAYPEISELAGGSKA